LLSNTVSSFKRFWLNENGQCHMVPCILSAVSILSRRCLEGRHQRIATKLGWWRVGLILSVYALSKKYSRGRGRNGIKLKTYVGIR
jgi:hypothetical protein